MGPRRDHIVKDNGVGLAPKVVDSIMAMGAEGSTVESVCGLHTNHFIKRDYIILYYLMLYYINIIL